MANILPDKNEKGFYWVGLYERNTDALIYTNPIIAVIYEWDFYCHPYLIPRCELQLKNMFIFYSVKTKTSELICVIFL